MQIPLPGNLVCFSHLRWDFVFQRPQHLMSLFARTTSVYYIEEAIFDHGISPRLAVSVRSHNLRICVPQLPFGLDEDQINVQINALIANLISDFEEEEYIFWYYTPMALKYTAGFNPVTTVYDCMDELAAFKFAPKQLGELEKSLFEEADIVFTGGYSLYESKQPHHHNIYPFPSSIDKAHFARARSYCEIPEDQSHIEGFKIGFYGVLDERFDIDLIAEIALQRPEWQIILIGPVVKIDPAILPRNANIHYLGPKDYQVLPLYLSGWDVALIPFLLNESTVFISPTKTPEYLAAGKPVVSTAIRDVVSGYEATGTVRIGKDAQDFIRIIDTFAMNAPGPEWLEKIDLLLANNSWEDTFNEMTRLIAESIEGVEVQIFTNESARAINH